MKGRIPRDRHIPRPYWFIHHLQQLEWSEESIANRIKYIKRFKPVDEVGVRLLALKPVKQPKLLPPRLAFIDRQILKVGKKKSRTPLQEFEIRQKLHILARMASDQAERTRFMKKIDERHKKEYPCAPVIRRDGFKTYLSF